jgi:RNA polymerase sigma-70 factor, ECF subfamily
MAFACEERTVADSVEDAVESISPAPARSAPAFARAHFVSKPGQPEPAAEQLAERSQAGCLESFDQLVLGYENRIFNFLYQFTRNRHDAEDLTQITFLKAFRGLPRYHPTRSFAAWLYTIARRTALNHLRAARSHESLTDEADCVAGDPAGRLESKDEQQSIWKLARALKPKQYQVLWLRYGEGFSVGETARIMRVTQLQVRVLLHRARNRLAKSLTARRSGSFASAGRPLTGSSSAWVSDK